MLEYNFKKFCEFVQKSLENHDSRFVVKLSDDNLETSRRKFLLLVKVMCNISMVNSENIQIIYLSSNLHHSSFSSNIWVYYLRECSRTINAHIFRSECKVVRRGTIHQWFLILHLQTFLVLKTRYLHDVSEALPATANIDHFNEHHTMPHRERFLFA